MIRIITRVKITDFEYFQLYISQEPAVKMYQTMKYKDYKYNYVYSVKTKEEEYSFWVGYRHNSEKVGVSYQMCIEFNPNKVPPWDKVWLYLMTNYIKEDSRIVSCDVAIDLMNINIQNIVIDRKLKRDMFTYDKGGDNKTYYLGKGAGRVKIYNKARERGMEGVNWTRYEVSLKIDEQVKWYEQINIKEELPGIYCYEQMQLCDDKTITALVYAVMNGYPVNDLSRTYKEKIKKMFNDCKVSIDNNSITKCIREYVKELLTVINT
jgi:DNA relaxase NicK